MRMFKKAVKLHQTELSNHVLFDILESSRSAEPIARIARAISWWPMVFQDVLRLNFDRVDGTEFARAAKYHRDEDAGHDKWFVEDLRALAVEPPGLEELFGEEFQPIRDACYSILVEVNRAQPAVQRIALVLALESTGHIFFEKVADAVDRVCPELPLRYFARFHLGVEKDHDLFTDATTAEFDRIALHPADRIACEQMLTRVYAAFARIFSFLADGAHTETRNVSQVRQLAVPDMVSQPMRAARSS